MAIERGLKVLISAYLTSGTLHMVKPQIFNQIVPSYLPGEATTYTYASGVAELANAALLINPKTRSIGGLMSVGLLVAVWPANVEMARQWLDKPWPQQLVSIGRLPLQIPMITSSWRAFKGQSGAQAAQGD